MTILFASDHAGFALKTALLAYVRDALGQSVEDCTPELVEGDDYPDTISVAARRISADPMLRAIVVGGSGQGEAMVANRFPNVRAAVFYGPVAATTAIDAEGDASNDPFEIVHLSRVHNESNILSLGARFVSETDAREAVKRWLASDFSGDERHARRIKKIETVLNTPHN